VLDWKKRGSEDSEYK